jgi:LAO/AO transport system kinase
MKFQQPTADEYVRGVLEGDRTMLARAITLVESNAARHRAIAQEVVQRILPASGGSIRVGVTGVPGVGKSTFIETLGCNLCGKGRKLAVLAVDPTSSLSHGSILGDKTRMERLAREPNCFIRPSPSSGELGGVTRKSRETILLCEASGFDIVLVETVGVGQSEITVRSMVDFFLVLHLAGAGDELQGIKKGIIELADAIAVTKADGDNRLRVEAARVELSRVLHYLTPATPGWHPEVLAISALEDRGVAETWAVVERFHRQATDSGLLESRRHAQTLDWLRAMLAQELWRAFSTRPDVLDAWPRIEREVIAGELSAAAAAKQLLQLGV